MADQLQILILGAGGFVGQHLRVELAKCFGSNANIVPTSLQADPIRRLRALDILDVHGLSDALQAIQPTHVINLAGISAPQVAANDPELARKLHAIAPETLGKLLLRYAPDSWLLHISSGLVYGRTGLSGAAMTEECALEPIDHYALTKAAGDLALGVLADEGLKCLRLRPFNHTGPGQSTDFVVPAFASQIANIAGAMQPPIMRVGNLAPERDFLDVRDVVTAYVSLIQHSQTLEPGSIYNIASGKTISVRQILDRLIELSGLKIRIEKDPDRQRKSDLPQLLGSARKLHLDTGWEPQFDIEQTLRDTFHDFKQHIAA